MKHLCRLFPILICLLLCAVSAAAAQPYGSVQNQRYDGYEIRRGIDVSEHNGSIDWAAAAASGQADFVFIRVGYRGYSSGGLYPDSRYRENLNGALAAEMDVGVYIYSQATSVAEAREEAEYVLELLRNYTGRLTLPVVMDLEYAEDGYAGRLYDAHLSVTEQTEVCNAFCEVIRRAGLTPCIYANQTMLSEHLNVRALNAEIWLANHVDETGYSGEYTFWQYSAVGSVRGLIGEVDCNYWYYAPPSNSSTRARQITLWRRELTLDAGQTILLTASVYPSYSVDTLRFYSDDPSIAYVDKLSGEITSFRAGQTRIRVETGNGLCESCTVTVVGTQSGTYGLRIIQANDAMYAGVETRTTVTVESDEASEVGAAATVTADLLNLRAWPYKDYAPITTLKKEDRVTILDSVEIDGKQWVAVRCADGTTGFLSPDYLDIQSGTMTLTEGVDYVLRYADNDRPGYGTVTAEGIGAFTGSDSRQFRIYSFDDVQTSDWYFGAVSFAVRSGLMNGTSDTTFSPNVSTSRAMLVTILYRLNGSPMTGRNRFSDVALTDWYGPAVIWAAENGVDAGVGEGLFNPGGTLTRAYMALMLFNNTRQMGYETPVDRSVTDGFSDWGKVPESAREAVRWAVGAGLITGMGDNTLSPNTGATRAQICTIMERYEALLARQNETPLLAGD